MPKRIGNTQIPSVTGLTDIINLKQHKNFVEQGIFPSTDNHVVNSLRFDGGSYLSRNMSGTGQAKWTFSFWVKRSALGINYLVGESYASHDAFIGFDSTDTITFLDKYCSGGCKTNLTTTNAVYRDLNSFYHVVFTFNGSESTVSDGFKIYVNSQLMTSNAAADQWPRNSTGWFLGTMYIGRSYSANYLRGYMAEVNFIDGQELTPTDFGYYNRSTDQWKPKKYTGTYGANGFLLEFKDSSNVGKDTSGNGNDWTSTGFVSSDNVTDSPHNTFATLNPLQKDPDLTLADGSLSVTTGGVGAIGSTFYVSSGVYYWEIYYKTTAYDVQYGLISDHSGTTTYIGDLGYKSYGVINFNGNSIYNNTQVSNVISAGSAGDVYRILLDMDQGEWSAAINSGSFSTIHTGITAPVSPAIGSNASTGVNIFNFGQDPTFLGNKTDSAGPYTDANGIGQFCYQPPTGALALCTQNLPAPTIEDPEKFFKCVAYVGDGNTSGKTITTGLAADFVWIKNRDAVITHVLFDSVRGVSKVLQSASTGAEYTDTNTLTNFGNNSFTVGSNDNAVNQSSIKYISWCWKAAGLPAAGGSSAAGSARVINEDGGQADTTCAAIATAVTNNGRTNVIVPNKMSINHKSGFSIVQYSGTSTDDATLPTGINDPEFTIIKNMSGGNNSNGISARWPVSLKGVTGTTKVVYLDDVQQGGLNYQGGAQTFNNDSVHIYKGTDHANGPFWRISETGSEYIMYCWKSIPGYSKFGSYEGNGVVDGPFVYLGFKPAFLMLKNIDDATDGYSSWYMADSVRSVINPAGASNTLFANKTYIEGKRGNGANIGTNNWLSIDFLSNGFKVRAESNYETNQEAKTYIYMAFAEQTINFTTAR